MKSFELHHPTTENPHNLFDAIKSAEDLAQEYADYFENGADDNEMSACPLPYSERATQIFIGLHDAICMNMWALGNQEMDQIASLIQEVIFMGIDDSELLKQFCNIMILINIHKKRAHYGSTIMNTYLPN